ncbi:MAG: choice-of-anchor B family protein [Saprospiraceae bacterium]
MKNYIYTALITIISLSLFGQDSLNMKKMGLVDGLGYDYNDVWGYRHGSKEFAVIGSDSAINIIDVSDCANPTLVHQWVDGSTVIWRDFKEYDDYIYAICDGNACQEGLQVINKNDFTHSQSLAFFRKAHNIYIDKPAGRLYVAGANTNYQGLIIYDIATDPANPIILKVLNFRDVTGNQSENYYVHDVYVENDTAYCSHGYPGFRIWDITNPNNVSLIAELENGTGGYNHSSWKHPNAPYMYVAEEVPIGKPMYVYDISDITEPFETYNFKDPLEAPTYTNNRPHNPFVNKERLYISYYHDGIQVYDLEDPELPNRVAYYDTYPDNNGNGYSSYHGAWGCYPFLPSGCILASDIEYGLHTLKLNLIPESKSSIPNYDFVIDNAAKGVVFVSFDDVYHRYKIDISGNLEVENLIAPPTDKIEFVNSNLQFDSSGYGIIFKSTVGKYFRLKVDNFGIPYTIPVTLPSSNLSITSGDLYFSQYKGGLILQNSNSDYYHITVNELNSITSTLID